MATFFDSRKVVNAEDLRGPRVYSTDMTPSLYDASDGASSIRVTERALKIKIISKGLVTLNCAHLVTPFAVRLFERNPDLLSGDGIVPAFRRDKAGLADYVESVEGFHAAGITDKQLDEHISRLEGSTRTVMPWELGDVGKRYRDLVVEGLRSDISTISLQLGQAGFSRSERERIAMEVEGLDFGKSANLRQYIAGLPESIRGPINRFTTACYHMIGTSVVRCETGTDLNPLSDFKMEDILLAGQVGESERLSEEAVFLDLFLATALDTIQSGAYPSQIIDAIPFKHAHTLSSVLREQGFQQKYDDVIQVYTEAATTTDKRQALEQIDPVAIASAVSELGETFKRAILAELPNYTTMEREESQRELYRSGTDLGKDLIGFVPYVGPAISAIISTVGAIKSGPKAASAGWSLVNGRP